MIREEAPLWVSKEKGQRIRAGLTAVMRTNTTASE